MMSPLWHRARRYAPAFLIGALALSLISCSQDPATAPSAVAAPPSLAAHGGPSDPTATWKIPLDASGLSLRSDGLYGDGSYSVYANGVCTVAAKIFATTAASNSGDATIQTTAPKGNKCGRTFTLRYPDASTETLASFDNLNVLENTGYSIPAGTSVARRLILNPTETSTTPSRCGRVLFGPNGSVSLGTDSVQVTRVDASTWEIASQPAPNDRALCENTGEIYEMPVRFVVVSSYPLP